MPDVDPAVVLLVAHQLRQGTPFSGVSAIAAHLNLPRETVRAALVVLERHVPEPPPAPSKRADVVQAFAGVEVLSVRSARARPRPR